MPPPDASMASSTFRLHPDFFVNFFRHQTRTKDPPRVFGCVVGTQHGPTVEIFDSFDLPASATRRRAFLEKKRKKGLSPDLDVLGWFLQYPYEIWPWFTRLSDACAAVSTLGFIKLDNKSLAWDADVGPGEDLAKFILRFISTHTQALIVPDPQLKYVIEKKLKVGCFFDAPIVHELMWGLNYVVNEFVPEERDNLTDECHLPLSKELEKNIRAYGFNVSPRMIDREFISTVSHLYILEFTSESLSLSLHHTFAHHFPGSHRMSDLEFAKAIADSLHSSEEMLGVMG